MTVMTPSSCELLKKVMTATAPWFGDFRKGTIKLPLQPGLSRLYKGESARTAWLCSESS